VRLLNVDLVMPSYASDYDIHKTRKHVIVASGVRAYTKRQQRAIDAFLAAAGENPRVSFLVTRESNGRHYSLLIPAQYWLLSAEPTLLTGQHTVVGKVMRTLRAPAGDDIGFTQERYTDSATIASFRPALRALPRFLLDYRRSAAVEALEETRRRLKLRRGDPTFRARLRELRASPFRSRARLQRKLAAGTTITAPGLVLLPLAIYK
jgi:hypothetical protein